MVGSRTQLRSTANRLDSPVVASQKLLLHLLECLKAALAPGHFPPQTMVSHSPPRWILHVKGHLSQPLPVLPPGQPRPWASDHRLNLES